MFFYYNNKQITKDSFYLKKNFDLTAHTYTFISFSIKPHLMTICSSFVLSGITLLRRFIASITIIVELPLLCVCVNPFGLWNFARSSSRRPVATRSLICSNDNTLFRLHNILYAPLCLSVPTPLFHTQQLYTFPEGQFQSRSVKRSYSFAPNRSFHFG